MSQTVPDSGAVKLPVTVAHCRSCNAQIYWLRNIRTGKLSPIEAQPPQDGSLAGNIRVNFADGTFDVTGPADRREHPDEMYFLNHFATCRGAARWRRKGGDAR